MFCDAPVMIIRSHDSIFRRAVRRLIHRASKAGSSHGLIVSMDCQIISGVDMHGKNSPEHVISEPLEYLLIDNALLPGNSPHLREMLF